METGIAGAMSIGPDRRSLPHDGDVEAFVGAVSDERRRADAEEVLDLMREVSGEEPRMWGPSMVGGCATSSSGRGRRRGTLGPDESLPLAVRRWPAVRSGARTEER